MMIEEEAVVSRVERGAVWVEKSRQLSCGSCEQSCSVGQVVQHQVERSVALPAKSDIDLLPGDRVVIGVRERALLLGALGMYLLPLAGLFAGALAGKAIALRMAIMWVDGAAFLGALLGLLLVFFILRTSAILSGDDYHVVVLRKVDQDPNSI
jgi:sigma-E factor negative regulatory protein RseC